MTEAGGTEGMNAPENPWINERLVDLSQYPVYVEGIEKRADPNLTQEDDIGECDAVMLTYDKESENQQNTPKVPSSSANILPSTAISSDVPSVGITSTPGPLETEIVSPEVVDSDLASRLLALLKVRLPKEWDVRVTSEYAHVMLWAPGIPVAIQRAIYAAFNGSQLTFIVHSRILPSSHRMYSNILSKPLMRLSNETLDNFADVIMNAWHVMQDYRVCTGVDSPNCVDEWFNHRNCRLDENHHMESDWERTLRTTECHYLISVRRKRCDPCGRYSEFLRKGGSQQTPRFEDITTSEQTDTDMLYQLDRVAKVLETQSREVDKDLQMDLESEFCRANGLFKVMWEEQTKANTANNTTKWHPLMLRWALLRIITFSPGYQAKHESGFVKLRSGRTLYEYSHSTSEGGVQEHVIQKTGESILPFRDDFFKYHVVIIGEVYVVQNVVYYKDSGEVAGYTKLDDVKNEIAQLEKELVTGEKVTSPVQVAPSMLTYLVKGVANGVRGIAAWYPGGLNEEQFYTKTWDIVRKLEASGVKVIAFSGNSNIVNQFFSQHRPITLTDSGVIFDTLNIFSSDGRPIFFFNSAYDLLRLIRNCFANSGAHKKTRVLFKNNEVISWQTIINIFRTKESCYCEKLTASHVFLNSSSIMKVHMAAQVMSWTVASYIERCKLPDTVETVRFIRYVNNFYDCLSGANPSQSLKTKNVNLAAYKNIEDYRFYYLMEFLNYLKAWEKEVAVLPIPESEKKKTLLSSQILIGIERTIMAFISAAKYLLERRTNPVGVLMAGVFQENPLENYTPESSSVGRNSRLENYTPEINSVGRNSRLIEARLLGNHHISDGNGSHDRKRPRVFVLSLEQGTENE